MEKGAELGISELWLFPGERSEKKALSPTQLTRYEQIITATMKQCGHLDLPKIVLKPHLEAWTELPCAGYYGAVGEAPPFKKSSEEACFTGEEKKQLERLGAQGVSLHRNILRTETAALVALATQSSAHQ